MPGRLALEGDLAVVGLGTLLGIVEFERCSGTILVRAANSSGEVLVREGRVIRARLSEGATVGRPALFALLACREGRFFLHVGHVDIPDEIQSSTSALLLEAARGPDDNPG